MKKLLMVIIVLSSFSAFAGGDSKTGKFQARKYCEVDFGARAESCSIQILEDEYGSAFKKRLVRKLKRRGYKIVKENASFTVRTEKSGAEAPGYSDLWNSIYFEDENGAKCTVTSTTPNESDGRFFPALLKEIWYGGRAVRAAMKLIPKCTK